MTHARQTANGTNGTATRIGIIGAGVSGMAAAWMLQHDHRVTLFEKDARFGGHAESLPVTIGDRTVYAEFGPRFFFDPRYPLFRALLQLLGLPLHWNTSRVSITDVPRNHTLVLPPRTPRHVAALLASPRKLRHLLSLRRLIGEQSVVCARRDFSVPFHRHLAESGFPASFGPEFIYPMLAACWGAPIDSIRDFPAYSLLKAMPPGDRAGFFEIGGGMSQYMQTFGAQLTDVDVRLGTGVRRIEHTDTFTVEDDCGEIHRFDQLILATSSRDAAAILGTVPDAAEMRSALAAFRHFETEIVVHGDPGFMPPDRRDWGHNNLFFDGDRAWMSDWPGLRQDVPVIRTWLPKGRALPSPLYGRRTYHHLLMTTGNATLQRRVATLQGTRGLWVAGMYAADVDNHESALLSAIVPVRALAPRSANLAKLLASVGPDAVHGLDLLPVALSPRGVEPSVSTDESRAESLDERGRPPVHVPE